MLKLSVGDKIKLNEKALTDVKMPFPNILDKEYTILEINDDVMRIDQPIRELDFADKILGFSGDIIWITLIDFNYIRKQKIKQLKNVNKNI